MSLDYTNVQNPVYAAADNSAILCTVTFTNFPNPIPFTAMANDIETHGQEIYAACVAGTYGPIGAYVAPVLTPAQLFANAIASGVVVTCEATPSLNGTYGCGTDDQANIMAEAQFIGLYQEFTNGDTNFEWTDTSGSVHTFPSTDVFMAFAKAVAKYVSACKQVLGVLQSGLNSTAVFPSNAIAL